jgi:hypothetical protein
MSNIEINKIGIAGISTISKALLGVAAGELTLCVSQGGLTNREAPRWTKELFKTDVLPFLLNAGGLYTCRGMIYRDRITKDLITGDIVCNISDGAVRSTHGLVTIENPKRG